MTLLSGTSWLPEHTDPAPHAPFVRTAVHGAALDALLAASHDQPGLALVGGDTGTGKTALADALATRLAADPAFATGAVTDVAATRSDLRLLRAILASLDSLDRPAPVPNPIGAIGRSGLDLLTELRARVTAQVAVNRRTVLLLDNAQVLTGSQLEIVRSLLGRPAAPGESSMSAAGDAPRTDTAPTVVLFATPELRDRVARRRGLASRLIGSATLPPLDRDDLRTLLDGRAATGAPPFSPAALDGLLSLSHGIPGRALPLAAAAQDEALARGWEQVDERVIDAILASEPALNAPDRAATAATQAPLPFGEVSPAATPQRTPRAQRPLFGEAPPALAGEEGDA